MTTLKNFAKTKMTLNRETFFWLLQNGIVGGAVHQKLQQDVINLTGFLYDISCNHEIKHMTVPDYSPYLNCSCRTSFYNDWFEYQYAFFSTLWNQFHSTKKQNLIRENLPELYLFGVAFQEKDILSQLPEMNEHEKEKFQQLCSKFQDNYLP